MNTLMTAEAESSAADEARAMVNSLVQQAGAVDINTYEPLMDTIATYIAAGAVDDIAKARLSNALGDNKVLGVGRAAIKQALSTRIATLERDLPKPVDVEAGDPTAHVTGTMGTYRVDDDAVWLLPTSVNGQEVKIGAKLEVLATASDAETDDNWGRVLRWTDDKGVVHDWSMSAALIGRDGSAAVSIMRQLGYKDAISRTANLMDYIMSAPVTGHINSVTTTGWHGGAYVTADKVYGSGGYTLQTTSASHSKLSMSGGLVEWRDNVAALAQGNSRLMFPICVALAAPLLPLSQVQNAGFHLHGASSDGKTTALLTGASVWGDPRTRIKTWRATANALEQVAAAHNHGLLVLDEVGQINPKEAGTAAYMLGNGEGKQRMTKGAELRETPEWSLLYLSSGEVSMSEIMKADRKEAKAGQELRLLNISSDAGQGMGVIEQLNGAGTSGELVKLLIRNIEKYHGRVGDQWLTVLTHPGFMERLKPLINNAESKFAGEWSKGQNAQVQRAAQLFAFVAAAGELATQLKLTGWEAGEAQAAVNACFDSWLDGFGVAQRETTHVLDKVRRFIDSQGIRFQPVNSVTNSFTTPQPVRDRVGFRVYAGLPLQQQPQGAEIPGDEEQTGSYELWVLSSQLEALAEGNSAKQIREALAAAGWIESTITKVKRFAGEPAARCYQLNMPVD